MRELTIENAISRVAERTSDNARELRKSRMQRRTEFTDLYGVPFYAESVEDDGLHKAKFYISVSPDLVYFMRYQFKLFIQKSSAPDDGDFKIYMNGVNITPYLIEQEDGMWIDAEGLYPTNAVEDAEDFYDVLDVTSVMYNEGLTDDVNKILNPGFKLMEVTSTDSFKITMYLYMKYSVQGI